jgi:signal transduction histidine kinase
MEGSDGNGGIVSITTRKLEEKDYSVDNPGLRTEEREQVMVSISDNGEGIHPEVLPRLFTKFATKSETGGTGLGLYITKSIIEAHGGRIWAQNNKDGTGATFSFTLPLSKKQQQSAVDNNTQAGHKQ